MNEDNNSFNSGKMPYYAPDYAVDSTRKYVYDSNGDVRSIISLPDSCRKKRNHKAIIGNIVFIFLAILILFELYNLTFRFTPKKWANERLRPMIIYDLRLKTKTNFYQDSVSDMVAYYNQWDSEMIDGSEFFVGFNKINNKNNLYFKTPEKIEEILGEENPKGYEIPPMPETGDVGMVYKAYYCYGKEDNAKWIIIKFDKNYSVDVKFTNMY